LKIAIILTKLARLNFLIFVRMELAKRIQQFALPTLDVKKDMFDVPIILVSQVTNIGASVGIPLVVLSQHRIDASMDPAPPVNVLRQSLAQLLHLSNALIFLVFLTRLSVTSRTLVLTHSLNVAGTESV